MDDADESRPDDGCPDPAHAASAGESNRRARWRRTRAPRGSCRRDDASPWRRAPPRRRKVRAPSSRRLGAAAAIGGAVAAAFEGAGAPGDRSDSTATQADLTQPDEVEAFFRGPRAARRALQRRRDQRPLARRRAGGRVHRRGWDAVLANNLTSVFLCSKHAIPLLRRAGGGAIVNLSSAMALVGGRRRLRDPRLPGQQGRDPGADAGDGVPLRTEGIRVNAIVPGLIATPMSLRAQSDPAIRSPACPSCIR